MNTYSTTLLMTHFAAVIWFEILFELMLDKFPRTQTYITSRVIVHTFVQVKHYFVLFVALITPIEHGHNRNEYLYCAYLNVNHHS